MLDRRSLLEASALLIATGCSGTVRATPSRPAKGTGKPGEFEFLAGEWRIAHRRLKDGTWDEFLGEATCWSILGGVGSIEELRIPARDFAGLGIRLLDRETATWNDYWVNAKSGVLATPGTTGAFADGVGTFISEETDNGQPLLARGIWDRITKTSCRWYQSTSRDGGITWNDDWFMDWQRA